MPLLPHKPRCLITLGRMVADEHGERALVIKEPRPKLNYAHCAPYVVRESQADEWERQHASHVIDPVSQEE